MRRQIFAGIYPPVGPHPLLFPPDKAARLMDVELECGRARIAANRTALNAHAPEYFWTPEAPAAAVPASVARAPEAEAEAATNLAQRRAPRTTGDFTC